MNYNQNPISGKEYTRCAKVVAHNLLGSPRRVELHEETVIATGEKSVAIPSGVLDIWFQEDRVVPIINPETLEQTGQTMTQGEIYIALFSVYMQAAQLRDEANDASKFES